MVFRDILLRRMEKFLSSYVVVPGYSTAEHRKVSKCLCSHSGIFYCGALKSFYVCQKCVCSDFGQMRCGGNAVFAHRIKLYEVKKNFWPSEAEGVMDGMF